MVSQTTDASGTRWIGARLDYFVGRNSTFFSARAGSSFRIRIGSASSPQGLATASLSSLGGSATNPAWGLDVNLSALAAELSKRAGFRPAAVPTTPWHRP